MNVLSGDVGGTNARLAIVRLDEAGARILAARDYRSRDAPGLATLVLDFLTTAATGVTPDAASIAIAGPVVGGVVRATNLPWVVDARELAATIGVPRTTLLNDFEAVGYALPLLREPDFTVLQDGDHAPKAPMALVGAGTGLGVAFLVWGGGRYHIVPSEGGHAAFAPSDARQRGLLAHLAARHQHVSRERVLSGAGLLNVYRYLAESGFAGESEAVREQMRLGDPAAVVSAHGLAGTDRIAVEALDVFVSAFGAFAGDLALTIRASGGVYLAGGIAPRIVERLRSDSFLVPFRTKGRLSDYVARVPVRVITHAGVGLLGAAAYAGREWGVGAA